MIYSKRSAKYKYSWQINGNVIEQVQPFQYFRTIIDRHFKARIQFLKEKVERSAGLRLFFMKRGNHILG